MCGSLMTIKETLKRLTAIRVDLMLTQGELLLMRSNLPEVHAVRKFDTC